VERRVQVVVEAKGGSLCERDIVVRRIICAGYAGRDQDTVRHHIEELKRLGVPAPAETPTLYVVTPSQVTTDDSILVQGSETSGEVEYVLFKDGEGWLVTVGSDHTDRELEITDIAKSKQICPKVIGSRFWRIADLVDHWDELVIKSWVESGGSKIEYQSGRLSSLLTPDELVDYVNRRLGGFREGDLLFSGTIPASTGLIISNSFEMEMYDPVLRRTIRHSYGVRVIG